MLKPFRYITLKSLVDAVTSFLNDNSAHFKENRDPRVVQVYDILKDACAKARVLLLEIEHN